MSIRDTIIQRIAEIVAERDQLAIDLTIKPAPRDYDLYDRYVELNRSLRVAETALKSIDSARASDALKR